MRKITKEAEKCSECGRPTSIAEWENFCDYCKKELDPWDPKHGYITTKIFPPVYNYDDVEKVEVCSWVCFFEWLQINKERILEAGHLSMPTIHQDNAKEFFEVLERVIQNVPT